MGGATEPESEQEGPATFAAALSCIDGRVQEPLAGWVRERCGVRSVDVVTQPGMDAVLARGAPAEVDALLANAAVSRRAHGAATLVVVGHADCAGNPVGDDQHVKDVAAAVRRVQAALPGFTVLGAFVDAVGGVRAVEAP